MNLFRVTIRIFPYLIILLFVTCSLPPSVLQPVGIELISENSTSTPTMQKTVKEDEQFLSATIEPNKQEQLPYGVVYPFSSGPWSEEDRLTIRTHLGYLKDLGVNTVLQVFSGKALGSGTEENWLIYLDEALLADIKVIAFLHPGGKWTDSGFDYQSIQGFLNVVDHHPALLAYLGLHEPLEDFTSEQLREFYIEVKKISPDLPIAHYMGNMAWFDKNFLRFPGRKITTGICDICITWYYPASRNNNKPIFEETQLLKVLQDNRKLLDNLAPDAQLWFLGQSYTQDAHSRRLRMPSPDEMEKIFLLATQEGMDGFLWYPWGHGRYDQVLSDEEMEPQRQRMRDIYDQYIVDPPTP